MFNVSKLEFTIEFLDPGAPAGFWGGRLRGIYGNALLNGCCDHGPMADYRQCPSFASCPYPFLFESTTEARRATHAEAPLRGNRLPPPFVLQAPFLTRPARAGDSLSFNMILMGAACTMNSGVMNCISAYGALGINNPQADRRPIRYRLADVRDLLDGGRQVFGGASADPVIADIRELNATAAGQDRIPADVTIEFLTPTRIINKSAPSLDDSSRATLLTDFHNLVLNLCNRIGGLWQLYAKDWPGQAEFYRWRDRLLKSSRDIDTVETNLVPFRDHFGAALSHKSARQGRCRELTGFVGTMRFAGDFSEFWTLLRIGEIVHIGNDTSSGLGQYKITA
jgi:hypothetical protein